MLPDVGSHRIAPRSRRYTCKTAILLARQYGIDRPLREEALHLFKPGRANAARFHRNAFRAATIDCPLRIFLPTAFATIRQMHQAHRVRVGEKWLEQLGKVKRVSR